MIKLIGTYCKNVLLEKIPGQRDFGFGWLLRSNGGSCSNYKENKIKVIWCLTIFFQQSKYKDIDEFYVVNLKQMKELEISDKQPSFTIFC